MGGPCDTAVSGETPEALLAAGMEHVKANHPEMEEGMKNMTPEQLEEWDADFHAKFEAAPETTQTAI